LDQESSLILQEGVVDNREFLGNSGTTQSVPCNLTSRSFSANNRWQQILWTSNDGGRSWENLNSQQPSSGVCVVFA